jgi:Leishmanolysin
LLLSIAWQLLTYKLQNNMKLRQNVSRWAAVAALSFSTFNAHAIFTITLDLTAVAAIYQPYFQTAKSFWESTITGYQPGIVLTGATITASTPAIDGLGGVLGSAGPDSIVNQGGFRLSQTGSMLFDSADVADMATNGFLTDVIKHEMAHVLGFGTLWDLNNVYVDNSGQYTGLAALAAYKTEFSQPTATFVPIEQGGGSGTANGHWDEVDSGSGPTGRTDPGGRDMRNELMTGWINTPTFVSRTTLASFSDIGYTVNLSAVPEPGVLALWLLGLPLMAGWASQRRLHA